MNWQEFLNQQAGKRCLSSEETQILLKALPDENTKNNQAKISSEIHTGVDNVKAHLQSIYDNFQDVCGKLANHKGAGKLEILRIYLKEEYYKNQSEATVKPINIEPIYSEFQSLITEKIQSFCGRGFVFAAFQNFTNTNKKGYFTVIGDAGMGKSTIAAKYVSENNAICYFNVLVDGRNRPELFLESIRQQLINRYQITNIENADLSTLLVKVTEKLSNNEKLIIVVDALDEVNQEPGAENILYLPKTLPDNVYFLLTRRRYEPTKERLYTEGLKKEYLDLTDKKYDVENADDIKKYIRFCLEKDPEHKNGLQNWITSKNITIESFIQELAAKSENNFMYLRYILPAIAEGKYNDLNLTQLPQGLQNYYQTHWIRMGMNEKPQQLMVIILFIIVQINTAPTLEMICEITTKEEYKVRKILEDKWCEYLKKEEKEGETCYSIYHKSFLDFLKSQYILDENRPLFEKVKQDISHYLY